MGIHQRKGPWPCQRATRPSSHSPAVSQPRRSKGNGAHRSSAPSSSPEYDEARNFHSGISPVRVGSEWGFVHPNGQYAFTQRVRAGAQLSESARAVLINGSGVTLIPKAGPPSSQNTTPPTATTRAWRRSPGWQMGIRRQAGSDRHSIPVPAAPSFSEGLAAVQIGESGGSSTKMGPWPSHQPGKKPENSAKGSARSGITRLWGLINPAGSVVAEPEY